MQKFINGTENCMNNTPILHESLDKFISLANLGSKIAVYHISNLIILNFLNFLCWSYGSDKLLFTKNILRHENINICI